MKIENFKLGQWWVSNDWAIKITKVWRRYLLKVVLESDCTVENIKESDDAIVNMELEKFCYMFNNKSFCEFIEKWGSVLKASDVTSNILDNVCNYEVECTKKELENRLLSYNLWEERYVGKDRNIDIDEVVLQYNKLNEEDKDGE